MKISTVSEFVSEACEADADDLRAATHALFPWAITADRPLCSLLREAIAGAPHALTLLQALETGGDGWPQILAVTGFARPEDICIAAGLSTDGTQELLEGPAAVASHHWFLDALVTFAFLSDEACQGVLRRLTTPLPSDFFRAHKEAAWPEVVWKRSRD